MENNKNYWRSRIEFITADNFELLQEKINQFCKDKFVVGIQYPDAFQIPENWTAVISYKIQEE